MLLYLLLFRLENIVLVDDIGLKDHLKKPDDDDFDVNKALQNYLNDRKKEDEIKKAKENNKKTEGQEESNTDKPKEKNDDKNNNKKGAQPPEIDEPYTKQNNNLASSLPKKKPQIEPDDQFTYNDKDLSQPETDNYKLPYDSNFSFLKDINPQQNYSDLFNKEINSSKLQDLSLKRKRIEDHKKNLESEINNLNNAIEKKQSNQSILKSKLQNLLLENLNRKNKIKNFIEGIKKAESEKQKNEAALRILNNELIKLYKLIDKLKAQQQNLQQQSMFGDSTINNQKRNLREETDEINKNAQTEKSIELDIDKLKNDINFLENNLERLKDILNKENIELIEIGREEERLKEIS